MNDALFVSTRRHFFWRDRSDPGPGGELLPEPALAGIDERNHHARRSTHSEGDTGQARGFERQAIDHPRNRTGRGHAAHILRILRRPRARFKCAQYGLRSVQPSACAHIARGSTGKPVITRATAPGEAILRSTAQAWGAFKCAQYGLRSMQPSAWRTLQVVPPLAAPSRARELWLGGLAAAGVSI